jgi:hypothetical protein
MNYQISITRTEVNTDYEAQLKEWNEQNRYGNRNNFNDNGPRSEIVKNALICELTEEQFKAVKAAVMESFT